MYFFVGVVEDRSCDNPHARGGGGAVRRVSSVGAGKAVFVGSLNGIESLAT